jgi:PAS domain S-box-containing protein
LLATRNLTRPALETLVRSETLLQEAEKAGGIGNWKMDLRTHSFEWSAGTYSIFNKPLDYQPTIETIIEATHPADRGHVRSALLLAPLRGSEPIQLTHRIVREDGGIAQLEVSGTLQNDDQGQPVALIGTVRNITEHYETQVGFSIWKKAIDSVSEGVVVVSLHGYVQDCNPAFLRMKGANPDQVLGRRLRLGRTAKNSRESKRELIGAVKRQGSWSGQIWDEDLRGTLKLFKLSVHTAYVDRKPAYYVVVLSPVATRNGNGQVS